MNAKKAKLLRKQLKAKGIDVTECSYIPQEHTRRTKTSTDYQGNITGSVSTVTMELAEGCGRERYRLAKKLL